MNHEQSHDQPQQPEHGPADPERVPTPGPQIWAASLADYNDGTLHGAWLDAAREVEAIETDIQAMLAASPLAA
jgi:antirestriction protein